MKRSAAKFQQSNSLVVETLVVADKKMVEKHGKESVTTYILTVMNMVRYYLFILYFVDLSVNWICISGHNLVYLELRNMKLFYLVKQNLC